MPDFFDPSVYPLKSTVSGAEVFICRDLTSNRTNTITSATLRSGLSSGGGGGGGGTTRVVTTATDTLLPADSGNFVRYQNASATTVIVPSTLPQDFNCALIEGFGAGHFTVIAGSGETIVTGDGSTPPFTSARNGAMMSVYALTTVVAALNGGMH